MADDSGKKSLADLMVGDRFWLGYAQELVRGAISGPEARAAQLSTAIAWFWTLYSASGVIAVAFGAIRLSSVAAFFVFLPAAILVFAYWQASRVSRPLLMSFDPRIPSEVLHAHGLAAKQKQSSLRWAERWTAIAGFCVALGLGVGLVFPPNPTSSLVARFNPMNHKELLAVAVIPRTTAVLFSVSPTASPACGTDSMSTLVRSSKDGMAQALFRVQSSTAQRVTATWNEESEKVAHSISVDVASP